MTTEPLQDATLEPADDAPVIGARPAGRTASVPTPAVRPGAGIEISGAMLAWGVLGAIFLALRLGPIWQAPVGGAEWIHLSGAWEARIGDPDGRFVPSLFQALSTLVLHISSSEVGPRVAAFLASASIPVALWMLRRPLGEAGALLALLLIAIDAPAIAFGASASALGFDVPIALWLFVLVTRDRALPPWLAGAAAFAVVTAGPIPLPLTVAWATITLARGARPSRDAALPLAVGAALGVIAASFRFGLGFDGIRIPALDLFAASFEQRWTSSTAMDLALLYSPPLMAAAAGAVAHAVVASRRGDLPQTTVLLVAWLVFAAGWFLASAGEATPAPLVAMALPAALLAGPALVNALQAMLRAEWRLARWLLPMSGLFLLFALAIVIHWGQVNEAGDVQERVMTGLLLGGAGVAALAVALDRRSAPALLALGLGISVFPVLTGTFGVALSAGAEPIPSPVSPAQARELRDLAVARAASQGGPIVIHPQFADAATWPFRQSGDLTIASRVPQDAAIAVWPTDLAPPEGMVPVTGAWSFARHKAAPTTGPLRYIRWFTHRNAAVITSEPAGVYMRTSK
ncbi:MAG: hypothetical protein IPG47_09545 [Thermoflexaceae bacterium]|nr:hypothetical protein [Thermoflexaceae bacterium]